MDPLTLLRDYTVAKKEVKVVADEVIFGDFRFPSDMPTNYRSKSGDFYPLNALVLFIQFADASVTDYLRASQNTKIPFIKTLDKQDLLAYLRGKIAASNQVQLNPAASNVDHGAKLPRAPVPSTSGGASKGSDAGLHMSSQGPTDQIVAARRRHVRRLRRYLAQLKAARLQHNSAEGAPSSTDGASAKSPSSSAPVDKSKGKEKDTAADDSAATGGLGLSIQKIAELKAKRLALKRGAGGEADFDDFAEDEEEDAEDGEDFKPDELLLKHDGPTSASIVAREMNRHRLHGGSRTALLRATERIAGTSTAELNAKEKENLTKLDIALSYYKEAKNRERHEQERVLMEEKDQSRNKKRPRSGASTPGPLATVPATPPAPSGPAIMLVPNVASAILNIYNIQDFLQNGMFFTGDEKKKQIGGTKPGNTNIDYNHPNGRKIIFQVIDNPVRLKPQDWERVVVILVQGVTWQFKGWKYPQPVDLFQRYLGVHVQYEDEKITPAVMSWNVKILRLNKHKRHLDQVAKNDFWRIMNEWISVNRPNYWV